MEIVCRPSWRALLVVAGALALAACRGKEGAGATTKVVDGPDVLATVGDRYALRRDRYELVRKGLAPAARTEYERRGRESLIRDFAQRQLLVLEAEDSKLTEDPEIATKLELARSSILAEAAIDRMEKGVFPETEVRAWYDSHKEEFARPPSSVVRQISVTPRKEKEVPNLENDDAVDEETAKRKIAMIARMAASGEDFGTLAKRFSEDPSARDGGLLGDLAPGSIPKPLSDILQGMKPGEIRGPVRTGFGFHLVRLEQIRPGGVPPYEEVRERVLASLREKNPDRRRKAFEEKVAALEKKYPITVHADRLPAAAESSGSGAPSASPAASAQRR